ncbi:hypothetical protein GCM10011506_30910 [Marivirga lumbricoides]|uniref:DUF4440 domain-containing protein n=1 Tax=Marivirga lumbricoides TaxID=1046115 RepID=A0ABQ1MM56_9BACT|nr:hypothetical protein GCM10011506_30910 [Marivirga lumbricoides]
MKRLPFLFFLLQVFYFNSFAQNNPYAKDVASIDAIMKALTEVISGPANEERDWERFKYLFAEEGKLIPTTKDANGKVSFNYWSPGEYIQMFIKNRSGKAFYEQELYRITEAFGNIAHCFSTYAVRTEENGPVERRGINSIQLLKGEGRWYIMNVFWSNELEGEQLPQKYLTD